MKKRYIKPIVIYDSFQLDAAIAAGCQQIIRPGEGVGYTMDGNYWLFTNSYCYIDVTDLDGTPADQDVCYHGPFNSLHNNQTYIYS